MLRVALGAVVDGCFHPQLREVGMKRQVFLDNHEDQINGRADIWLMSKPLQDFLPRLFERCLNQVLVVLVFKARASFQMSFKPLNQSIDVFNSSPQFGGSGLCIFWHGFHFANDSSESRDKNRFGENALLRSSETASVGHV